MEIRTFSFPTPTVVGAGALKKLPGQLQELGIRRPLVVTDPGLLSNDPFRALEQVLGSERKDREWFLYSGVHPNPLEADLREAAQACASYKCDGVIGLGGGSALDVAKGLRILLRRPDLALEQFYDHKEWPNLLPFVAIPTTAGTGSEVGRSSVVTLASTRRKAVLFHPSLLASLVLLDPELTVGLPPKLSAATGADALTHCIESFTCPIFHPLCDGIALEGIHLITNALPVAVKNGSDLDARRKMLVAAAMGGIAFQKDLGVVHSLAHPLSTLCGFHHGLANALCLAAGMRFCSERAPGIYRRVGIACGLEIQRVADPAADGATIKFIEQFLHSIGLEGRLADHGAKPELLDSLVDQAVSDPCHKTNVVPVTREDFRALYRELM